jgi:hypothetical protein
MKKEDFEIMALDYLRRTLSDEQKNDFERALESDAILKEQFMELEETWELMEAIAVPEPSQRMDNSFFTILEKEIGSQQKKRSALKDYFDNLLDWLMKPQLAYALLFLVLIGGYFLNLRDDSTILSTGAVADSETEQVREKLVLTLLEQPSANKRLEGVSEANKIVKVDDQVINALLRTLNKDPNVNVRLAAIESLTSYVGNPKVRQGLIQSIPNQESPIIQVTLANLMLALEEKKSIEPFKRLLEKPELDTTVKRKIEKTIKSII